MAKKKEFKLDKPEKQLAEIMPILNLINDNLFQLKKGTEMLIEMIDGGNLEGAKTVIDVFKIRESIHNLTIDI